MSKPDLNSYGLPRVRCVNCGRSVIWWLGTRWKHAAGGSKPQPKCDNPKPVPLRAKLCGPVTIEQAARLAANGSAQ